MQATFAVLTHELGSVGFAVHEKIAPALNVGMVGLHLDKRRLSASSKRT